MSSRVALAAYWIVLNLVVGYFGVVPLIAGMWLWDYLEAEVFGLHAAPFRGQEAGVALALFAIGLSVVVTVFIVANRGLRRRLASWRPAAFWAATVALGLIPFAWFMGTDRVITTLFFW